MRLLDRLEMLKIDTVEERAEKQADRHLEAFMDDCTWPEMLEKYAEVANLLEVEREKIIHRRDRGARIEDSDFADFHYYLRYTERMARILANNALVAADYERDKKGRWILKNQPSTSPTKKKFGFWNR